MGNKAEITGQIGAVPPPDAPIEQAAPLQPETIQHQQAQAAANERPLKPFKHENQKPIPAPGVVAPTQIAPATMPADTTTAALIADVFGDTPDPIPAPAIQTPPVDDLSLAETDQLVDVQPTMMPLTPEDRQRMPAASDSDTPSKGLLPGLTPHLAADKFDGISPGGFSDVGEAQYFPLDGNELLELARGLGDALFAEIPNDLRFSMALTYPRVRVTLQLLVEGHAEDNNAGFTVTKIAAPKDGSAGGTAPEIAAQYADKVCFVVIERRQELHPDGSHDLPPDAIRDELGLPRPRKQILEEGPMGQRFVDVPSPGLAHASALTR